MASLSSSSSSSRQRLRIGILGASRVVHKSWPAMHRAGHVVTALGCRDAARARVLVTSLLAVLNGDDSEDGDSSSNNKKQLQDATLPSSSTTRVTAPRIVDYDAVVAADDVDVVYITLPVALREPWVRACIRHGKHVVGEKPAAVDAAQLLSWLQAMAPRRLLYMDGTMLSHSRRVSAVAAALRTLGPLRHMEAHFAFLATDAFLRDDIRVNTALEPHGALGDVGWYCLRWLLHMVDFVLPEHVSGRITECTRATTTTSTAAAAADAAAAAPTTKVGDKDKAGAAVAGAATPAATTTTTTDTASSSGGAIIGFEGHLRFPAVAATGADDSGHASSVTATFDCSFTRARQQTVRLYARDGVVVVEGAINPVGQDRPYFTIERTCWASASAAAESDENNSNNGSSGKDAMSVQRQTQVVYCPGEDTCTYQQEQLWRDVADALVCVTPGEALCVDGAAAQRWSSYAYTTQLVMDSVLAAATRRSTHDDNDDKDDNKDNKSKEKAVDSNTTKTGKQA